jgi:AcrR family transcriptional regulator
MGIQERRVREREELQEKIMDAARALFAEQGYEAVTMRKIAERIEYSPTAIYVHFKDKESLILAICLTDFNTLAQRFQTIGRIADPVERLRSIGRAYADFALKHPNHYRLMFMSPHPSEIHDEPSMAHKGNPEEDAYAFLRMTVVNAMESDRFRPEMKDPDLIAQTLWAGIHGVVSLRIVMANGVWLTWPSEKRSVETMLDSLMQGVLRLETRPSN